MASRASVIEFTRHDTDEVLAAMRRLAHARTGWINLQPKVDADKVSSTSSISALFGRRPPQLTLGTWTAPTDGRKGPEPASVGVQHGRAHRVRVLLADEGRAWPAGWRVRQDAPRRGLVAELPDDTDLGEVLEWLLATVSLVSPLEVRDTWRAMVYPGRG
jgi:hypothetical protein